jgi:NADH-quinone oxidoreductase subunit A
MEVPGYLLPYFPVLVLVLFAAAFAVGTVIFSYIIGPRRYDKIKMAPYECGVDPVGDAHQRFPVKFYIFAVLFILFDIETVFIYPWAVIFRDLGLFGLVEMGFFIIILFLGLIYVWKKGALEWE